MPLDIQKLGGLSITMRRRYGEPAITLGLKYVWERCNLLLQESVWPVLTDEECQTIVLEHLYELLLELDRGRRSDEAWAEIREHHGLSRPESVSIKQGLDSLIRVVFFNDYGAPFLKRAFSKITQWERLRRKRGLYAVEVRGLLSRMVELGLRPKLAQKLFAQINPRAAGPSPEKGTGDKIDREPLTTQEMVEVTAAMAEMVARIADEGQALEVIETCLAISQENYKKGRFFTDARAIPLRIVDAVLLRFPDLLLEIIDAEDPGEEEA